MSKTKIQWATDTWNPVTGCTQIPGAHGGPSGCDNCYAKRLIDTRQSANPKSPRYGTKFEQVMLHPERMRQPYSWNKPRRIFVNSLSDLFHPDVPDDFIDQVFFVIYATPRHTYQILTKRPERMKRFVNAYYKRHRYVIPNVWLGTSISSNADKWRADQLRETSAAVRFLSLEPLLGPVNEVGFRDLHWIIAGGESGPNWRPMELDWARDARDHALIKGCAFFMKQVAASRPTDDMIPSDLMIRQYPDLRVAA